MRSLCQKGHRTKIMGGYVGYKDCNQLSRCRKNGNVGRGIFISRSFKQDLSLQIRTETRQRDDIVEQTHAGERSANESLDNIKLLSKQRLDFGYVIR